jgi:spore germination protein GerM
MKNWRTAVIVVLLVACAGLGVYLGGLYLTSGRRAHTDQPATPPRPEPAPGATQTVKVYRIAVEGNEAKLKPVESTVAPGEDPAEVALRRLIEQGGSADLANPIPEGTRLLSLKIKNGTAAVDLSREFRDNFAGGSEEEGLMIGAVVRTLGQFPDVKRVLFLVEGKPLGTLGHLDLSGPQDVDWFD